MRDPGNEAGVEGKHLMRFRSETFSVKPLGPKLFRIVLFLENFMLVTVCR